MSQRPLTQEEKNRIEHLLLYCETELTSEQANQIRDFVQSITREVFVKGCTCKEFVRESIRIAFLAWINVSV